MEEIHVLSSITQFLVMLREGEGFFVARDTNIAIVENDTWIASVKLNSRIYFSSDKGRSWDVTETLTIQGKSTTGIFSIAFYDKNNGYAIWADYTKPKRDIFNKIRTTDAGKKWKLVANNQNPGYISCVQDIPNSKGEKLVAFGFEGLDYSPDSGLTWQYLKDEYFIPFVF